MITTDMSNKLAGMLGAEKNGAAADWQFWQQS